MSEGYATNFEGCFGNEDNEGELYQTLADFFERGWITYLEYMEIEALDLDELEKTLVQISITKTKEKAKKVRGLYEFTYDELRKKNFTELATKENLVFTFSFRALQRFVTSEDFPIEFTSVRTVRNSHRTRDYTTYMMGRFFKYCVRSNIDYNMLINKY